MNTFDIVRNIVSQIPKGKVATYGQIAKLSNIRNVRVVVFAIHGNKDAEKVPCHRIVKKDGTLATGYGMGGFDVQKQMLVNEGIEFLSEEKVNLEKNLWKAE